jgi:hypothetical protein
MLSNRKWVYKMTKTKIWVVSESRFEGDIIRYICGSKKTALKRWGEVRDNLIKENKHMVEHCEKQSYNDAADWQNNVAVLQNMKPGELPDLDKRLDCPYLEEWSVEP